MAKARTIEGMVISSGGLCADDSDAWEHVFFICPWRESGGAPNKKQLRVVMPAKGRAAVDKAGRFRGKIVAIEVRDLQPPSATLPFGFAQGGFPPKVTKADGAMKAAVADRERPRAFKHATLGALKYLPDLDCLAGRCRIDGGRGELLVFVRAIDIDDAKALAKALGKAGTLLAMVTSTWKTILARVVDDLVDTCNDTWNKGAPLRPAELAARLKVDAIHLGPREATVYLKAGRLLRGHVVEARVGAGGKVREVFLVG